MGDVGIFYGHLVHLMVFCYTSWTFGIVRGNLAYFSPFGILYEEKSGNPGSNDVVIQLKSQTRFIAKYFGYKKNGEDS
jgi:hypothetical protein